MATSRNEGSWWASFASCIKCERFTSSGNQTKKKHAGWKSMPYILGNECFERLSTFGLLSNFNVYLVNQFNMNQVSAAILINVWTGTANFSPLIGAYISDSYLGKFPTLVYASFASLVGLVGLTLTAALPILHPPKCAHEQMKCTTATPHQLGILCIALTFLTIGAGGIKPCSIPFGVDQFDLTSESGRKGMDSYFNWYFFSFTIISVLAQTVVSYIQNNVSWAWGFAMLAIFLCCSILLFFLGTRLYIHVPPSKSVYARVAQVFVAAYRKRSLALPGNEEIEGVLYNPPLEGTITMKVPLTQQFRNLNKAGIILEGDINPDGSCSNKWNLCGIQQIEDAKCLIRVVPIWLANVVCFTAMAQQDTYTVAQALHMNRHIGPKFQIPPGSIGVITSLTLAAWIPIYDRLIVPRLEKITKVEGGITLLQRMGIGMVFAICSVTFAGLAEIKRRASFLSHPRPDGVAQISVWWLMPQLVCFGMANAFVMIGQVEFYYKQFPEHMKNLANSIFFCTLAGSGYLCSILVSIIHKSTGRNGHPNWLDNNINAARLEYFYFLIAGLGVLNLVYYLVCASRYHYKNCVVVNVEEDSVIELNSI